MYREFVIAGNGPAGLYAARILRRFSPDGVLIVAAEPHPGYSRCLLPELIKGKKSERDISLNGEGWYRTSNIDLIAGQAVTRVDTRGKAVYTSGGEEISYGSLLIATGADPFIPTVRGIGSEGVMGFRNLEDVRRILGLLSGVEHAVIMGGGFIGLKVAEALVYRGKKPVVVEKLPWLLPRMLDETAARLLEKHLTGGGVRVITGKGITEICQRDGRVCGVTTEDGTYLEAEIVIVAVGVVPSAGLVEGSGIEARRGIPVDEFMRTSDPCIYAAGDVALARDYLSGNMTYSPIWPNAAAQARVAALNMLGHEIRYEGSISRNSVSVFGLPVMAAGLTGGGDDIVELVEVCDGSRLYRKKIFSPGGSLLGFMSVGDAGDAGQCLRDIRRQSPWNGGGRLYSTGGVALLTGGLLYGD